MSSILFVAIAPVDNSVLPDLSESIGKILAQPVDAIQSPPLDGSFAFNFSRNQYNSTSMLSALLDEFDDFEGKILGVTGGDLFVPVLTYVFGEAQFGGKAAVVSLHRLREEFYGLPPDENIFKSRLLKEAIHELGHTFGLIHCSNYLCAMHSSTGVEDIDVKTERFCEDCGEKLRSVSPSH
jgi:archaemetzincin